MMSEPIQKKGEKTHMTAANQHLLPFLRALFFKKLSPCSSTFVILCDYSIFLELELLLSMLRQVENFIFILFIWEAA